MKNREISDDVKHNLDVMLAHLMSREDNRVSEMGREQITPDMLSPYPALKFEREMLAALHMISAEGMPPTVENVSLYMHKGDQDTKARLEAVLAMGHGEKGLVRPFAVFIHQHLMQDKMLAHGQKAMELLSVPNMDLDRLHDAAVMEIMMAKPSVNSKAMNELEAWNDFFAYNAWRVQRVKDGLSLGATFPLAGMREKVAVLGEGDMTLITGAPKIGKTTTVLELSDHFQQDNVDTVIFWMETSQRRIRERKLARRWNIPGKALKHGTIDFSQKPWNQMRDIIIEEQQELWENCGRVYNVYCPGAMLEELTTLIYYYARIAEQRNRPLVVIVDYLQVIGKPPNKKTDYEAISHNATTLKDVAGQNNCHVVLFSQESTDASAKSQGDSKSYGTTIPIQRAQIHIAIERVKAEYSYFVSDDDGNILKNAMGQDRIWQFPDKWAALFRYNILRANDDDSGLAYALCENPLFKVRDVSESLSQIPEFALQDLKTFESRDKNTRRMRKNS